METGHLELELRLRMSGSVRIPPMDLSTVMLFDVGCLEFDCNGKRRMHASIL